MRGPQLHPLNSPPALPPRPTSRFTHLCALRSLWCVCLELQVFRTMDFHPSDPCLDLCTLDCASERFWVQSRFTSSQCNRMHCYIASDNIDSKLYGSRDFLTFLGVLQSLQLTLVTVNSIMQTFYFFWKLRTVSDTSKQVMKINDSTLNFTVLGQTCWFSSDCAKRFKMLFDVI